VGNEEATKEEKSTMSNWYWKRVVAPTAALGVIVGCGLLGAGTASAGTNGQHVAVLGTEQVRAQICGWNQHDSYGCTPVFDTSKSYRTDDPYKWWWVSKDKDHLVTINGWDKYNNPLKMKRSPCTVPKVQPTDWTLCDTGW
jgi:hypothetical protein